MPIETLLQLDDTRMRRAAAKLTHVGEQTGPVSSIVMQVYYYLPSLDVFRSWRTPGISYGNDELPVILNFSVAPDEFRRILEAAFGVRQATQQSGGQPSLSFAAVADAPEGVEGGEMLFTYNGGVAIHRALSEALDPANGMGQIVLQMQRRAAYASEADSPPTGDRSNA